MLHVLLIILKIIGIILLLALFLIFLILTVPIRYSFQMEKKETASFQGRVKVTWFFALLYVKVSYIESVFDYRVRLAGYQILGNQEDFLKRKEEKEKRKQEKKKKQKETAKDKIGKNQSKEDTSQKENKEEEPLFIQSLPNNEMETKVSSKKIISDESKSESEKKQKTSSKNKQKKGFFVRGKKLFFSIGKSFASLRNNVTSIRNLYEEYHGEELLRLAKNSIIRMARHILPRKIKGTLRFGFDDPATTGMMTGIAAIFYPKYQNTFCLEPDFQDSCFEGNCAGRGRIHPGFFLILMIQLLLNNDVRKCIKLALK